MVIPFRWLSLFLYICAMQNRKEHPIRYFFRKFANKYTFVGLLFVVWIIFFDKYSFIEKGRLHTKIFTLEKEKNYYVKKIEENNRKKGEIISNRDNLEKFAREQYLMKNENEDIFILIEE